jgi:6-phosphogluconolactonase/glucosamine-6-phosphate isomerase/deaminase
VEIPPNVFIFDTPEQVALAAAERFVEYDRAFHGELDRFSVALAGGNTPRRV